MRAMSSTVPARSSASLLEHGSAGLVRLERLPELDDHDPLDIADRLDERTGLALLETARPGRRDRWSFLTLRPLVVLEAPADGPDPFAEARALLGRMSAAGPIADGAGAGPGGGAD
jgi:hypothetical protein